MKRKDSNIENAAISEEASPAENGKLFAGEVMKSRNIVTHSKTGKKHSYIAVSKKSKICNNCYPDDGNNINKCSRPCFAVKCHKCGYYGHGTGQCKQSHHAESGVSVQH